MDWRTLISDKRFGLEHYHDPKKGMGRSDFRRDYDRLVFSSPFRRLQNKTQVFPLPGSVFVHNRLTHSMEVASVGRSLAESVAELLLVRHSAEPWAAKLAHIPDIVSACCLAHDLGNPPFGHSGEKAISAFFREGPGTSLCDSLTERQWLDFVNFDGNANSLRVLTHQFRGRRPGGFAMTYSMLASVVKYPHDSLGAAAHGGKFGIFDSECADYERIATELGIKRIDGNGASLAYARHPLVYIVEAADDICYEVMDIEDAHKLRILSTGEVTDALLGFFEEERRDYMRKVMSTISDPNEKVGYMRSCVIGRLVESCAHVFVDNEEALLSGTFQGSLIKGMPERERKGYEQCSALSMRRIYNASDVVDIDLAGNRILTFLMEKLVDAVTHPDLYYSQLLLSRVPEQYDVHAQEIYERVQSVVDHVSAMTDVYALDLYRRLCGHTLPAV